jgi:hypothetical protein
MSAASKIESAVAQPHQMSAVHDNASLIEDDEYEYGDTDTPNLQMRARGADGFHFTAMRASLPTSRWPPTWPLARSLVSQYAFAVA